jgi:hypothetical protein
MWRRSSPKLQQVFDAQLLSLFHSVVMALPDAGFSVRPKLPFGIGNNQILFTGISLILLFVVMMLRIASSFRPKNLSEKDPE